MSNDLKKLKRIFGKSISLKNDLKKGEIIEKKNILMKKPAIGFTFIEINKVVGKIAKKNISAKRILRKSDIR